MLLFIQQDKEGIRGDVSPMYARDSTESGLMYGEESSKISPELH